MKAEDFLDQEIEPIDKKITSRGMSAEAFLDVPTEEPIGEPAVADPAFVQGQPPTMLERGKEAVTEFFRPSFAPESEEDWRRAVEPTISGVPALEAEEDLPPAVPTGPMAGLTPEEAALGRPISTITGKPVPTPEERMPGGITEPGKYDFMDRAREIKEEGVVPFIGFVSGGKEIKDIAGTAATAYKLKRGDAITSEERADLLEFVEKANRDTTFGYKVINTVAAMPAFMQEFLATGPIYRGVQKVTKEGMTRGIKHYLGKSGAKLLEKDLGKVGMGVAAGVAGATIQAPIMGAPRLISGTIERSMPKLKLSRDEQGNINAVIAGEGEELLVAATKSLGDQWAETVSEHGGGFFNILGRSAKNAAVQAGLFSATMKVNPGMSPNKVNNLFRQVGYHGVINEMMEEEMGRELRAVLGVQEYKIPTAEQLAVELVSFSVPGVIQALGARAFEKKEVPLEVSPAAPDLSETQRELAREVIQEELAKQPALLPAILGRQIPIVPPGMPPPVAPEPTELAPGMLPPGQGFEFIEPAPETRLRPGPKKIIGPEYPEGAEYVAGRPAPEELEVEYKPILGPHGLPWKEEGGALKAFGSKRLKNMGVTEETHEVVPFKKGFGIVKKVVKSGVVEPKKEIKTFDQWLGRFSVGSEPFGRLAEDGYAFYLEKRLDRTPTVKEVKGYGEISRLTTESVKEEVVEPEIEKSEVEVSPVKPEKPVVEKPPVVKEKPAEPPMSPELRELHDHKARTLGFEKAGGSFVEGYLKKLAKVAEKTDMSTAMAAYNALDKYKKGNINQAALEAEKILGKLHKAETEALISKPKAAPEKITARKKKEVVPEVKEKVVLFNDLSERAKGAIASDAMGKGQSVEKFINSEWLHETVDIESLKEKNKSVWSDSFVYRKSETKGPLIVATDGEILDGNNRLKEAIERNDKQIEILKRIKKSKVPVIEKPEVKKPFEPDLAAMPLEKITVETKALREATGEMVTTKENAKEALARIDEEIAKYKKLLECL